MLNIAASALLSLSHAPATEAWPAIVAADAVAEGVRAPETTGEPSPPTAPVAEQTAPAQTAPPSGQAPAEPERPDVLVTARHAEPGDPLAELNAKSFAATQAVDSALIGPVALAYKAAVPRPVRGGIHNFLYNLREPLVFVNFLLQFKPGKAAETLGRFLINSTVGVAGVLDVAKTRTFRLPRRANGFADTMGYYGIKNGAFLFLPITGPTTVRDLLGGALDRLLLPVAVGKPFTSTAFTAPVGALGVLDHRADFDPTLRKLHDNSDPYVQTREFYLRRRQAEIDHLHGRGPGPGTPVGEAPVDSTDPLPIPPKPAKARPAPAR